MAERRLGPLLAVARYLAPYRWRLATAAAALLVTAGATLALGKGIQVLIDQGLAGGTSAELGRAVGLIVLISAVIAAGTFIRFYLVSWLGERVSADLRLAVFNNLVRLHPAYFEDNRAGEILSRLTADTTLLQTIIGSSLSMALRNALTLTGALVMMFITNLGLSLIIATSVPLVLLPILVFGRRVRRLSSESQDSIASVGSYAGEIFQNIKVVQSFNREAHEADAFRREVERAFAIARRRVRQRAILVGAAILLLFGGLAAMIWSGGQDVIAGRMSGGELAAFAFYAIMVGTGFATLSEVWGELQRAAGAAERLLELAAADSALPDAPRREAGSGACMAFEAVTFHYPSRPAAPALADFSLDIPAGRSLALVGPSGAGKSTVFELLQRFYDPDSGRITLDGTDLRDLSLADLREQLALVPQQPVLFSADVRYNIAYGRPGATDAEIEAAARRAHAHEFIERLPAGYGTELGDRGVRLSGGQRQRIALARAILKDPKILLLDEATSALDAESEHQVQLALAEVMAGRTTVIIAHRLATIRHVDRIAVMDGGRLVATGSHAELLADNPLYARLAKLQFRDEALSEAPLPA
ncbi:MAG: ABC transporter transmembrane domain-containing protein [Pseudohaliea sp.]